MIAIWSPGYTFNLKSPDYLPLHHCHEVGTLPLCSNSLFRLYCYGWFVISVGVSYWLCLVTFMCNSCLTVFSIAICIDVIDTRALVPIFQLIYVLLQIFVDMVLCRCLVTVTQTQTNKLLKCVCVCVQTPTQVHPLTSSLYFLIRSNMMLALLFTFEMILVLIWCWFISHSRIYLLMNINSLHIQLSQRSNPFYFWNDCCTHLMLVHF
jgi:hypothetical protein